MEYSSSYLSPPPSPLWAHESLQRERAPQGGRPHVKQKFWLTSVFFPSSPSLYISPPIVVVIFMNWPKFYGICFRCSLQLPYFILYELYQNCLMFSLSLSFFCFCIFILVFFAAGLGGTIKKVGHHFISFCRPENFKFMRCVRVCVLFLFSCLCFLFSFFFCFFLCRLKAPKIYLGLLEAPLFGVP